MIDGGGSRIFIAFFGMVLYRFYGRIVKYPVFKAAISKSPSNANGANGIQTVGILHDLQLFRLESRSVKAAFERHVPDNLNHMADNRFINA
ncbi:hypothetical protein D9M68_772600 [compost metagenome]